MKEIIQIITEEWEKYDNYGKIVGGTAAVGAACITYVLLKEGEEGGKLQGFKKFVNREE
ncbi:MAG: hypothetical protein K0R80_3223 [Clostridia bacterium]|jgi:hypothetical protein|nr:hypothetical protein [Clostridia bacterium]